MICKGVSAYKRPNAEKKDRKETLALLKTINRGRALAKPQASPAHSTGPSVQSLDPSRVALPLLGKFPPSRKLTSFPSNTELTVPKWTRGSPVEKPQASPALPTWPSLPRLKTSGAALPLLDKFPLSRPCTCNPSNLDRTLKTEYSGKDIELFVCNSPGYPRMGARK
ncbi:hypothetical protein DPX16_13167 [Anabarilius grahami]|uniref:Uncharacterized protein n=1 Tax=Anabarilius grahami TaxID=495550 RepID=A0A3N0YMI8_ANAGA|nr:hypothetical protein DPX16_13167 [Anabarilius grahami]